jgi:hypothetical protein
VAEFVTSEYDDWPVLIVQVTLVFPPFSRT